MSCYSFAYVPRPPRAWSRVQHACTFSEETSAIPSIFSADMLAKGNVLQYKANSARLSKSQRYSLQVQKKWTNRNTTWASQNPYNSQNTNPNTQWLQRTSAVLVNVNATNGAVEGLSSATETTACSNASESAENPPAPSPILPPSPSDNNGGGGDSGTAPPAPVLPPSPSDNGNSGSGTAPPISVLPTSDSEESPLVPAPIVIEDGGRLICSVQANPCTGEVIQQQPAEQAYHLTSDSDVPGVIRPLYWNDGIQTWFPRQNLTMNNSGNKWPYTTSGTPTYVAAIRPPLP